MRWWVGVQKRRQKQNDWRGVKVIEIQYKIGWTWRDLIFLHTICEKYTLENSQLMFLISSLLLCITKLSRFSSHGAVSTSLANSPNSTLVPHNCFVRRASGHAFDIRYLFFLLPSFPPLVLSSFLRLLLQASGLSITSNELSVYQSRRLTTKSMVRAGGV